MGVEVVDWARVRRYRVARSGLFQPYASPEEAATALLGVQAQILQAAGLALWNRVEGFDDATLDARLHADRTLIKLWGQRGTLHLYASEEWPLVHAAIHRAKKNYWRRAIERDGGDLDAFERLVARAEAMLREAETLGRSELRDADLGLEEWHLSSWGGLFSVLVHRGLAVHAAREGNEGRFAHRERWRPDLEWDPPAPDEARADLMRRYMTAYGPATIRDFAYWAGAGMADARRVRAALGDDLVEVEVEGQPMLHPADALDDLTAPAPEREAWPVRLLYRFDPLLLGHRDKSWMIDMDHHGRVWRPAGHIEGTILEHGRIVGTWRYDRGGGGLVVTVRPFAPLPAHTRAPIERHAAGVAAYFDLPLVELVEEPDFHQE